MTVNYTPESMKLANSVLDLQEYLPKQRVYLPVSRNMELTMAVQTAQKKDAPASGVWYMNEDGRVAENDLLLFLKTKVHIKGAGMDRSSARQVHLQSSGVEAMSGLDSKPQKLSHCTLDSFYDRITSAPDPSVAGERVRPGHSARTRTVAGTKRDLGVPRLRICSAHPRLETASRSIVRPCTLPSSPRQAPRSLTANSLVERDITISELDVFPHPDPAEDSRPLTRDKIATVCNVLNLSTQKLPRRCNLDLVKAKSTTSQVLLTVLNDSTAFHDDARYRNSSIFRA